MNGNVHSSLHYGVLLAHVLVKHPNSHFYRSLFIKALSVLLFKQEKMFIFSTAECHSLALEHSHWRTPTGHLQCSVQEQEVSQQPVDAKRQTCKMSLQPHPSSGTAWSVGLMARTQASPHTNSAEA
jgi:hypothetical protein